LGFGFKLNGLGLRVYRFRFTVLGLGFKAWGLRFRVWGLGLGFRVKDLCLEPRLQRLRVLGFRV